MALSGESVAQILYQAGFRGQDLINMVAISKRESGWNPAAHRTDNDPSRMTGDMGLFQINSVNWPTVSQALGLSSKSQLFDPLVNAKAAMVLFQQNGLFPWGMGPNGWAAGGDPFKGTNRAEATQVVQSAQARGLLGSNYTGPTPSGGGSAMADTTDVGTTGPVELPYDMKIIAVIGPDGITRKYAIKELAPGIHISYSIRDDGSVQVDPAKVETLTQAESDSKYGRGIVAGDATELAGVSVAFGTFDKVWESVVGQVIGYNNPALKDPSVMAVLAVFAGRPDMSMAELENRLRATDWYRKHTQAQLEWNDLSDAEKDSRRLDAEARMSGAVMQFLGVDANAENPLIANHLEDVASGKITLAAYGQILKGLAAADPESPHSRSVREEEEAKRQRPIDIENTSQRIRETAERWGVQWSAQTIQQWAKDIVEKRTSDEDLLGELRKQAQILYPWKSPEVETATAAAPWLETYRRVMEKSGSIFTPEVAKALQAGQGVFDFETALKKSSGWLETKNGRDEMYSSVSELGRMMGF
jgi:hypothetical protein